jgi:acyl carrier protein
MIKSSVREFIVSNFYVPDPGSLGDAQSLLDSGIMDSTGVFDLIAFLESTYGFKVKDEEMLPDNLDSLDHIASYVARKQSTASVTP